MARRICQQPHKRWHPHSVHSSAIARRICRCSRPTLPVPRYLCSIHAVCAWCVHSVHPSLVVGDVSPADNPASARNPTLRAHASLHHEGGVCGAADKFVLPSPSTHPCTTRAASCRTALHSHPRQVPTRTRGRYVTRCQAMTTSIPRRHAATARVPHDRPSLSSSHNRYSHTPQVLAL